MLKTTRDRPTETVNPPGFLSAWTTRGFILTVLLALLFLLPSIRLVDRLQNIALLYR